MSFKNLSWEQVVLSLGLLFAVIAAYKLLGEVPAGVLLVFSSVVNLMLGRSDVPPMGASNPEVK